MLYSVGTVGQFVKGFPSTMMDDYQLNVVSFIKHAAKIFPDQEIIYRTAKGIFKYNYGEAYKRIIKLANALKNLGAEPGDRIAVVGVNTHRYYELYFAVPGIGSVLLQINPRLPPQDILYIFEHSRPKFLFVDEILIPFAEMISSVYKLERYIIMNDSPIDKIYTTLKPIYGYEELIGEADPSIEWPTIDEKSACTACYTGGTTGRPKAVYYSHRALYLHCLTGVAYFHITLNDIYLQLTPMFHANGWGGHYAATFIGTKQVYPGYFTLTDIGVVVDLIINEKVTITYAVPIILKSMLEYIMKMKEKPDLSHLRIIVGGSEPPLSMIKSWEKLGVEIIHAYGGTETGPLATFNLIKPTLKLVSKEEELNLKTKQGLPVLGVEVEIVDEDGNPLPHDGKSMGEVVIRGLWVAKSYYNDPRTKQSFIKGWFRTGDVGTIDEHGYLKLCDRLKDVIKSGGEWISSVDLENTLMEHPSILEACVIGIPHPKWEERPLALIVLRPEYKGKVSKDELRKHLLSKFAKWQIPDDFIFIDEIPKTGVAKADKKVLKEEYKEYYARQN